MAVWLQDNVSGKFGVAVGTWVENFGKPFTLATPSCARDLSDFSEQHSTLPLCSFQHCGNRIDPLSPSSAEPQQWEEIANLSKPFAKMHCTRYRKESFLSTAMQKAGTTTSHHT